MDKIKLHGKARRACQRAEEVLAIYEDVYPCDGRPRQSLVAAWRYLSTMSELGDDSLLARCAVAQALEGTYVKGAILAAQAVACACDAVWAMQEGNGRRLDRSVRATYMAAQAAEIRSIEEKGSGK